MNQTIDEVIESTKALIEECRGELKLYWDRGTQFRHEYPDGTHKDVTEETLVSRTRHVRLLEEGLFLLEEKKAGRI